MSRPHRNPHGPGLLLGLTLGLAAYITAHALDLAPIYYLPAAGTWTATPPAGAIAMGYYGLLLTGLAGLLLGLGLGAIPAIRRLLSAHGPARWLRRAAALAVILALVHPVARELSPGHVAAHPISTSPDAATTPNLSPRPDEEPPDGQAHPGR